jgi:hypothetical protein
MHTFYAAKKSDAQFMLEDQERNTDRGSAPGVFQVLTFPDQILRVLDCRARPYENVSDQGLGP